MVTCLNLSNNDLQAIAPQIKALLRMKAIYDPVPNEEAQLEHAFSTGCGTTAP